MSGGIFPGLSHIMSLSNNFIIDYKYRPNRYFAQICGLLCLD